MKADFCLALMLQRGSKFRRSGVARPFGPLERPRLHSHAERGNEMTGRRGDKSGLRVRGGYQGQRDEATLSGRAPNVSESSVLCLPRSSALRYT